MSQVLTEDATAADFSTGLTAPANGDNSAVWFDVIIAALQQIGDRDKRLSALAGATASTLAVRLPLCSASENGVSGHWVFGTNGNGTGSIGGVCWSQANVAGARSLFVPFSPPPGRTITAYRSRVRGNLGHPTTTIHSSLPATMPTTDLIRSKYDGSALETIDTVTDPSASVAVYDDEHDMTKTLASPHTVSSDYSYYVRIVGETGANSVANALGVFLVEVTYGYA